MSVIEKFDKKLNNVLKSISYSLEEVKSLSTSLHSCRSNSSSLKTSLELVSDELVKTSISLSINEYQKEESKIVITIKRHEDNLKTLKMELKVLQDICDHPKTEFDHLDYHRNEEFHKCLLCGLVI